MREINDDDTKWQNNYGQNDYTQKYIILGSTQKKWY